MTKCELRMYIEKNLLSRSQKSWYLYKCEIPELFEYTSDLPADRSISERVYFFMNDLKIEDIMCRCCGKVICKFGNKFTDGYREFCSVKCSRNSDVTKEKYKNTCLEKYGVDNPRKYKEISDKIENTNMIRFGSKSPLKSENVLKKIKKTLKENYGVEVTWKSEKIRDKCKKTLLEKYGVDNPSKVEFIREKINKTNLERYGTKSPIQNEEIKNKMYITNMEKYGVQTILESKIFRGKGYKKIREKSYDKLIIELKKKNLELLMTKQEFVDLKDNVKVHCNICNKDFETKFTHLSKIRCDCFINSHPEKNLADWIQSLNVKIIRNDRKIIAPLELDIFLPDYNIAIEFNRNLLTLYKMKK